MPDFWTWAVGLLGVVMGTIHLVSAQNWFIGRFGQGWEPTRAVTPLVDALVTKRRAFIGGAALFVCAVVLSATGSDSYLFAWHAGAMLFGYGLGLGGLLEDLVPERFQRELP